MIWSPKFETMPRPELEKLQLERLKAAHSEGLREGAFLQTGIASRRA